MGGLLLQVREADDVQLALVDLPLARALWEGVPTARLLARARLQRDAQDLAEAPGSAMSTWDTLMARLAMPRPDAAARSSSTALDRIRRAVVRHARAASNDGPVNLSEQAVAALVHELLAAKDVDASPAEGAADDVALDPHVAAACRSFDLRLGAAGAGRRAAPFEACLEVATIAAASPVSLGALLSAVPVTPSGDEIYPWGEAPVPAEERRAVPVYRAELMRVLVDRGGRASDGVGGDVSTLAARSGTLVLFARGRDDGPDGEPPRVRPSSWIPADFSTPNAARHLATALERGVVTAPRARSVLARGGDTALDAAGREMLDVTAHPFASNLFAEVVARAGRERDIVRLVTFFAVTPDVAGAAYALSLSSNLELPRMLAAWLESMLPADGSFAPVGEDPASSGARLSACLIALLPYPHLDAAARPLRARLSDVPLAPG